MVGLLKRRSARELLPKLSMGREGEVMVVMLKILALETALGSGEMKLLAWLGDGEWLNDKCQPGYYP